MTGSNAFGDTKFGYVFRGTGGTVSEVYAYLYNGRAGDISNIYAELYTVGNDGLPATLLGTSNPVSTDDVPDDYTLISFTFSSPVTVPVDFAAVITVPAYTDTSTDITVCSSADGTVIAGDEALPVSYGAYEWETMISAWSTTKLFDLAIFPVVESSTIDLKDYTGATAVADIETDIAAALGNFNTVYVKNTAATAFDAGSNVLTIDILPTKKVEWSAAYEGSVPSTYLLNLTGTGTFEVTGGSITQNGNGAAIYTNTTVSIIVSGGAVSAASGAGIYSDTGNITVSGGTVSSGTGIAIYGRNITVSGGVVHSTTGYAIRGASGSTVNVSGGFVFAYGTDILGANNVINDGGSYGTLNINPGGTDNGVVVAWDKAQRTTYYAGTSTDLSVDPAGTAKWGIENGKNGIVYTNGANSGFFEISGITLKEVSSTIDLADYSLVINIEEDISVALQLYGTVYVENTSGSAYNAGNNILEIDIPASKKVEWNAAYEGAVANYYLLDLTGAGTFEVTGGSITQNGSAGAAIYTTTGNNVSIIVSGGAVSATSGDGIYSSAGNITVSGGTVLSTNGSAIYSTNSNASSSVTVSGGTVSSRGNAINSNYGATTVSGGTVSSTTGTAIASGGAVTVSGGFVFAYGPAIDNVIYMVSGSPTISGNGVVVAWNQSAGTTSYTEGTTDHLVFEPAGATVMWSTDAMLGDGISYSYTANATIYAQWSAEIYTYTVAVVNGGYYAFSTETYGYDHAALAK